MRSIRVSVEIDAPVQAVWDTVAAVERHVEWMADAVAIRVTSPQRGGRGARFVCVTKIGPFTVHDTMEITRWAPPREMGVRHEGTITGDGLFVLTPIDLDRRTRFTWTETLRFPWWMGGPLGVLVAGHVVLRAVWRRNLARLARLVEAAAAG